MGARRWAGPSLAVLLVSVGMGVAPAPAAARSPGRYVLHPYRAIRFRLRGSHGFRIEVSDGPRHLAVTTRRGPAVTTYESRGRHPRSGPRSLEVHGRVAGFGRVDVLFSPDGRPRHQPPFSACTGPGPTIQRGTVHGEISFQGEREYTGVTAHRAEAEIETVPGQTCHYLEAGHSTHPPRYTAKLFAGFESPTAPSIDFDARRFAPGERPAPRRALYEASSYDRRGPLWITRWIRVAAGTSTFLLPRFSVDPENAVIAPPAPFSGSGTFARTPESTFTWSGDLAVTFPGTDPVALSGQSFRVAYCALRDCIDQEAPDPATMSGRYGSPEEENFQRPPR